MGEEVCYLPLVDPQGRLQEGPVILWPSDGTHPPPPGACLEVRATDLEDEPRLRFFADTARERRLVLLHTAEDVDTAEAVQRLVLGRLGLEKK